MALFNHGSFEDLVSINESSLSKSKGISELSSFEHMEVAAETPQDIYSYNKSVEERGLSLKSIKLLKGSEGLLGKLFNSTNQVFFMAWVYDLSGEPIQFYPGEGIDPSTMIIALKKGDIREFIGVGINLFPKRIVTGGIVIRIHLYESDEKTRDFGKVVSETADAIQKSELKNVLSLLVSTSSLPGAVFTAVSTAAIQLTSIIGKILQKNGNDHLDFFEGYYPVDYLWYQDEKYSGNHTEISFSKY